MTPVLNRRSVLLGLASATTVMATPAAVARRSRTFFDRIGKPIGLQVYTLGPEAGMDLDATFAAITRVGFREIELPNLLGRKPLEVAAAATRAGLAIRSVHVPLVRSKMAGLTFGAEPAQLADTLGTLGAKWAVAPIMLLPAGFRPGSGESLGAAIARSAASAGSALWQESAELLNSRAEALRPLGISVAYHNHNIEFASIGGTTGWDILLRDTQPGLVSFELDLGWAGAAGLDPLALLKRLHGRVRLLHVKDIAPGTKVNHSIEMIPAEVGSGTFDWARILPAAHHAGVEHYFVEQEPPFSMPRIDSAAKSYTFLAELVA